MTKLSPNKLCFVAFILSAFLGAVPVFAASYSTLRPPGAGVDAAYGINNNYQVVGSYTPQSGGIYGFLLSNGSYQTLQFPNAPFTYAFGVNDNGEIVGGYHLECCDSDQGFVYRNGQYSTLDYPGSPWTDLWAVNNVGDIVGTYRDSNQYQHGFLYHNGTFTNIDVPGAAATVPTGINNHGEIVGTYYSKYLAQSWGFTLKAGVFTTINYPGTNGVTHVNGVNDYGQLVGSYVNNAASRVDGFSRTANGKFEHLRYPNATATYPWSINKHNRAVGYYEYPFGPGVQRWGFTVSLP